MEEEIEKISMKQLGMKWGVISALVGFAYFMILNMAGLAGDQALGYVGYIFFIAIVVLAHKAYKEGDGFMSYGDGFKLGAVITVISSVISSILTYVYIKFVDDSMLEIIRDKAITDMEDQGMGEEQIEQAMGFAEMFMSAEAMLFMGLIFGTIIGLILVLIVTAFTKNADPSLEM